VMQRKRKLKARTEKKIQQKQQRAKRGKRGN
jgi:hypothetical protein